MIKVLIVVLVTVLVGSVAWQHVFAKRGRVVSEEELPPESDDETDDEFEEPNKVDLQYRPSVRLHRKIAVLTDDPLQTAGQLRMQCAQQLDDLRGMRRLCLMTNRPDAVNKMTRAGRLDIVCLHFTEDDITAKYGMAQGGIMRHETDLEYLAWNPVGQDTDDGKHYKATIIVNTYKRLKSLKRLLYQLEHQDCMYPYQVHVLCDGDPETAAWLESDEAKLPSNFVVTMFDDNRGGWGYRGTNWAIASSRSDYIMWCDDDDEVRPNHVENYIQAMLEDPSYDLVLVPTKLSTGSVRVPRLKINKVGHSESVIKTEWLQQTRPHASSSVHDFNCIEDLIRLGARYRVASDRKATYLVHI